MRWKLFKAGGKRGQMEMVGLVVIVILITLGMLFMATFALNSPSKKKVFTREGLAYSTMSAVMKTTLTPENNCAPQSYAGELQAIEKDILDDCAKYYDVSKSEFRCIGPISKKPLHSCDYLNEMIVLLLNQTLGQWNKNYEFYSKLLTEDGQVDLVGPIGKGSCPKYKDRDASPLFPLATDSGPVESVLYLCD